jgi:hypothetical protein
LQLIDEQLGKRNASGYGHGELFRTWFEIFFCGGEVAEDVQEHLRPTSESIPGNRVAAPDTLLRVLKGLATEDTIVTSSSGKEYRFNINEKMNDLNIKSLLLTGQLEKGKKSTIWITTINHRTRKMGCRAHLQTHNRIFCGHRLDRQQDRLRRKSGRQCQC